MACTEQDRTKNSSRNAEDEPVLSFSHEANVVNLVAPIGLAEDGTSLGGDGGVEIEKEVNGADVATNKKQRTEPPQDRSDWTPFLASFFHAVGTQAGEDV